MSRRKPTGFVAVCQCGEITGALDAERTDRADMGRILGRWLMDGCTVEPRFESKWSALIRGCCCDEPANDQAKRPADGGTPADGRA